MCGNYQNHGKYIDSLGMERWVGFSGISRIWHGATSGVRHYKWLEYIYIPRVLTLHAPRTPSVSPECWLERSDLSHHNKRWCHYNIIYIFFKMWFPVRAFINEFRILWATATIRYSWMNHRVFPGIGQFQQHFNQLDSINTKRFTFAQSICLLNGRFDWRQKFPRTCFCCASHCSLLNVHNILSQNPTKRWKLNKTRKRCATKLYNWLRIAGCCEEVLLLGWFPV